VPTEPADSPLGPIGLILPTFPQDTEPTRPQTPATADDPGSDLAAVCRQAEQLGASALWACDHVFWHGSCLECMVALTVAATATERAMLGTCVVQLPLRQACVVAKQAATLQTLTGGRMILGVGVGSHPGEYAEAGVDYHSRGRRSMPASPSSGARGPQVKE
jgi:alkanesulfonate monooxygenase SsuD/methylene tetrahydromethanopterin reductase-like flavin-dependent oxidoreductase (luciferase family)